MSSLIQICLIGGSVEYPSRIRASLDFLALHLNNLGSVPQIWDLAQDPLPLFGPRYYPDPSLNPSEAVRRFAYLANQADAFIWGSPVYHNSFSGVLKNALDNLTIHQFHHKPVAFISCGTNERTGSQPCDHLRNIVRGLHGIAIPTQLITIPSDFTCIRGGYHLTNEALQKRALQLAKELLSYAALMRPLRARPAENCLLPGNNGVGPQPETALSQKGR